MNVRQFLVAERAAVLRARYPRAPRRSRSRLELIDWLFDGADDMSPTIFREILADVINGKRNLPKSVSSSEATDLLQRWIEASRLSWDEDDHA